MTGRTNSNKISEKTKSPSSMTEMKKTVKGKANQSRNYEALSKDHDKKPLSQSIGLKEAIDSARRSFEKGFKGHSSGRKRIRSGSNNLSSRNIFIYFIQVTGSVATRPKSLQMRLRAILTGLRLLTKLKLQ